MAMNQSQQMINDISSLSGELTEEDSPLAVGDKVRFGGGAIHGRYIGEITRLFGNGKASVKSTVRGREKVFHPDMDDMILFTEGMDEAGKPKAGEKVTLLDRKTFKPSPANFATIDRVIGKSGKQWEVEDESGEEMLIVPNPDPNGEKWLQFIPK
jgi:hypothetical protein